jgi:DNA-binding transcriptional LysR family regulator
MGKLRTCLLALPAWSWVWVAAAPTPPPDFSYRLFSALELRRVSCPAHAFQGGRQPHCGVTPLAPEAFVEAADRLLEHDPATDLGAPWAEDHGVWLRYFDHAGVRYALVYTPLDATFNVQLVRLK